MQRKRQIYTDQQHIKGRSPDQSFHKQMGTKQNEVGVRSAVQKQEKGAYIKSFQEKNKNSYLLKKKTKENED